MYMIQANDLRKYCTKQTEVTGTTPVLPT